MRTIDIYNTKIMELIEKAKLDGLKVNTYETKIKGYEKPIECGISITDGKDNIKIPIYKDDTIEILE